MLINARRMRSLLHLIKALNTEDSKNFAITMKEVGAILFIYQLYMVLQRSMEKRILLQAVVITLFSVQLCFTLNLVIISAKQC